MTGLAIVVLLAVPLWAGDVPGNDVVAEAKTHVHDYSLTPADSLGGVIERSLENVTTTPELFALIRERFGLKEETARLIGIAALHNLIVEGGMTGQDDGEREQIMRDLSRDYAAALRSDPSSAAVAREYLVLIADEDNHYPDAAKRIRDVLRGLAADDRALAALQVMSDDRVRHANAELFEVVTESAGLDPLVLAIAGDEIAGSSSAELFDRAAAVWVALKDVQSAAAASSRAIYAYANRRSLADVLRVYRRLPAEGKALVSKAPAAEATVRSRGVERRIGTRDIRFTLAAVFILDGDPRAAQTFLPVIAPEKVDLTGMAKAENDNNVAVEDVLLAAIDSPGGDAFDLVTAYLQHVNEKTTALVDEVFDRVATRAGYSAASKWRLETAMRAEEQLRVTEEKLLPKSAAALLPPAAPPVRSAAAISDSVARLLEPEMLASFVERPVEDGERTLRECDVPVELRAPAGTFPPGLNVLRLQTQGDQIVVLGASQDVDPVGAASAGGYWIGRSMDGGATWSRPLYTGLRSTHPYDIVPGSTLPLIIPDGVRIDVVIDGNEEPAPVPSADLFAMRTKENIAIDLKWRDLERDSDHDGLTDLMEERILTDPNAADSDGDGIPDGADPLPQVAFRKSNGNAAEVAAVVLDAHYGERTERSEIGTRTIFVAGDPSDFAGLRTRFRIIVLSEAELAAVSKKFGPTLATHLSPIILDYSGTRAWVKIDDECCGATFLLEKKDGVWIPQRLASWIT
jgi:hypothetical protein